jgi:hypothetical protein
MLSVAVLNAACTPDLPNCRVGAALCLHALSLLPLPMLQG